MTQKQKVVFIAVFIFVGFLVSVGFHFYVAYVLKLNYYPYNTFLFRPTDRFGDFLDNFNAGHDAYTKILVTRAMFPLFVLICRIMFWLYVKFMQLVNIKILLLILYLAGFLVGLSLYIFYNLRTCPLRQRYLAWISMLLSFPVLISLDRANFENGIFLMVALSVILLIKRKVNLAAVILGIASALKPYSAIFFLLFVIEEQFWATVLGLVVCTVATAVSLMLLPTPFPVEIHNLQGSLAIYNEQYVVGNEGMYFGNSLFGLIKSLSYLIGDRFHLFSTNDMIQQFIQSLMGPYLSFSLVIAVAIAVILFVYKMPWWQRAAVVALCMNLLPYIGGAYRLLYFLIPLLMFLGFEERSKLDFLYLILFGLLFIPKGYIHFSFTPIYLMNVGELDDEAILHPVLMLFMLALILWQTMRSDEHSDHFSNLVTKLKSISVFKPA